MYLFRVIPLEENRLGKGPSLLHCQYIYQQYRLKLNLVSQIMNNVGSNIKRLREQNGYTQDYMAPELDIVQATYARIESGEIKVSTDRL
jgi:ribosome-binding protein aMBF1 (putative translation factor)